MAYGTPADPVAGTVITVAYAVANFLDPIRALRAFTGGADPPGTGYVVSSDSTLATSWKTILSIIGYTPANKAGDTFIGPIAAPGITSTGAMVVTGQTTHNDDVHMGAGDQLVFAQENGPKILLTEDGQYGLSVDTARHILETNRHISFHNAAASAGDYSFTIDTQTHAATFQGALAAASAAIVGAVSAASATLSGALNAASAAITNGITAATVTATGIIQASRFTSTVSTGTAPLTVTSTTEVANLRAATATTALGVAALSVTDAGVAAANKDGATGTASMRTLGTGAQQAAAGDHAHTGMAKIAANTYTGNGGATRAISGLGFTPKRVDVQRTSGSNDWISFMGHDAVRLTSGFIVGFAAGNSLDGDGFTVTLGSGMNDNAVTYRWVAIG